MRRPVRSLFTPCLALAGLAACGGQQGIEAGPLSLSESPPGASMRAGYVTLVNHGPAPRTLVSANSEAWGLVEFHVTETVDGVARMREETRIELAPGEEVRFEPYGRHLMLMRPTQSAERQPVSIELCFADGECLSVSSDEP